MHCIMHIVNILCNVFNLLYSMHWVLCIVFYALSSMHCFKCIVFYALYVFHALYGYFEIV